MCAVSFSDIRCSYDGFDASTRIEVAYDIEFSWLAGAYEIFEHLIHDMLVKNAKVTVGEYVLFERFEFDTVFIRSVDKLDGGEIGKTGFWANAGKFWNGEVDHILPVGILVRPGFDFWKLETANVVLSPFVGVRIFQEGAFFHAPFVPFYRLTVQ
jgi:hypothetical protein